MAAMAPAGPCRAAMGACPGVFLGRVRAQGRTRVATERAHRGGAALSSRGGRRAPYCAHFGDGHMGHRDGMSGGRGAAHLVRAGATASETSDDAADHKPRVSQKSPGSFQITFSRDVAGFLIGKKGASVRAVSKKANVRIDSKDEGSNRVFTIKSNRRNDQGAVTQATSILNEAADVFRQMSSSPATPSSPPPTRSDGDGGNVVTVQGVDFSYNSPSPRRGHGGRGGYQRNNRPGQASFPPNASRMTPGRGPPRGGGDRRRGKPGGGNQQRQKSSIGKEVLEKKRSARNQRRQIRASKASVLERQEIFEVPEEGMSISDLAVELAVDPTEIVKVLFSSGRMVAVNQAIDAESVNLVAEHYGVEVVEKEADSGVVRSVDEYSTKSGDARPPVVAIMGHVDHGKTTLLDYLRKSDVAEGEAGGITQSIGAYSIAYEGKTITLLDTPGHEAFSAMRKRGTSVTDIVVIVVAADDGVKPQTVEAIKQAQEAKVPIIVAITKMDSISSGNTQQQTERVKQGLSQNDLLPEEWGGDVVVLPISAKTGEGVPELVESILLLSDIHDYQGDASVDAKGTILEANLDTTCGPVVTCLVQAGTLRVGDIVTAGVGYGRVKSMVDASGAQQSEVGPSFAVQMVGLSSVPSAGDPFKVVDDESKAREMAEKEEEKHRQQRFTEQSSGSYWSSRGSIEGDDMDFKVLNVVLRASASGSLEALKGSLQELPQEKVFLRHLTTSTGTIRQSDVDLASTSDAVIIGFDVAPTEEVLAYAKQQNVTMIYSEIIYSVVEKVEKEMLKLLDDVEVTDEVGEAEVLAVFGSNKSKVAGCRVTQGFIKNDCRVEVTRKKRVVFTGDITSLRIVKDNVVQVDTDKECGIGCENFDDWEAGDTILALSVSKKPPSLA